MRIRPEDFVRLNLTQQEVSELYERLLEEDKARQTLNRQREALDKKKKEHEESQRKKLQEQQQELEEERKERDRLRHEQEAKKEADDWNAKQQAKKQAAEAKTSLAQRLQSASTPKPGFAAKSKPPDVPKASIKPKEEVRQDEHQSSSSSSKARTLVPMPKSTIPPYKKCQQECSRWRTDGSYCSNNGYCEKLLMKDKKTNTSENVHARYTKHRFGKNFTRRPKLRKQKQQQ
jgi:hypothetical protein